MQEYCPFYSDTFLSVVLGWKFVRNYVEGEKLSEKFTAEIKFCKIDPRQKISRRGSNTAIAYTTTKTVKSRRFV
jgi:hypothetical protein